MTYSRDNVVVVFSGGKWKKAYVTITYPGDCIVKEFKELFCLEVIEKLRQEELLEYLFQAEVWNDIRW